NCASCVVTVLPGAARAVNDLLLSSAWLLPGWFALVGLWHHRLLFCASGFCLNLPLLLVC
ncbi:Os06g0469800, partial [Oryza sativa Japonica Group]